MKSFAWRLLYFACGLLIVVIGLGCGRSRSRAVSTLQEIGLNELRADLTIAVNSGPKLHDIPESAWPESVRRFSPIAVQQHRGGVLIVVGRQGKEQEGLLVMLDPKDDPGSGGSGVEYEQIRRGGVFWCIEKIRTRYIPPEERSNR